MARCFSPRLGKGPRPQRHANRTGRCVSYRELRHNCRWDRRAGQACFSGVSVVALITCSGVPPSGSQMAATAIALAPPTLAWQSPCTPNRDRNFQPPQRMVKSEIYRSLSNRMVTIPGFVKLVTRHPSAGLNGSWSNPLRNLLTQFGSNPLHLRLQSSSGLLTPKMNKPESGFRLSRGYRTGIYG